MDPLSILAGGGLLVVGAALGWVAKPSPPKEPGLMCTCAHGYGSHARGERCQAQVQRASQWTFSGKPMAWRWVACPCLAYDGPEPLPRVWVP